MRTARRNHKTPLDLAFAQVVSSQSRRVSREQRWNPWPVEELRSGQVSPETVRRRIGVLRVELEDAVFFKYPEERVRAIEASISDLEAALAANLAAYDDGVRRRATVYVEKTGGQPGVTMKPSLRERSEEELGRLRMMLRVLDRDMAEALRFRDPQTEIDSLAAKIDETRRRIGEILDDLVPKKPNRGLFRATNYLASVESDIKTGKMSMDDVQVQLEHHRRILVETLDKDHAATSTIRLLKARIRGLESALRRRAD